MSIKILAIALFAIFVVGMGLLIRQTILNLKQTAEKQQDPANEHHEQREQGMTPSREFQSRATDPSQTGTTNQIKKPEDNSQGTKETLIGWFVSSNGATWILVIVGIFTAFAALLTINTLNRQTDIAKSSAEASQTSAKTAQDALDDARKAKESSEQTAANTLTEMQKQSGAMVKAAAAYERAAAAVESSNKFVKEELEQPYISLQRIKMDNYDIGKTPAFQLEFLNAGRIAARIFIATVIVEKWDVKIEDGLRKLVGTPEIVSSAQVGPFTIAANQPLYIQRSYSFDLDKTTYDNFENGGQTIMVRGEFAYGDGSVDKEGKSTLPVHPFCMIYTPWKDRPVGFEVFDQCTTYLVVQSQPGNAQHQ